ncbi:MAG: glycosyltransferase family 9 protein [Chthoniobacterales bacterium]
MKIFIFKPDGIGDFVLATGVIRKLAEIYGEDQLMICVRSIVGSLAKAQFPKAHILELPVIDKRIRLNLFVANFLRCFKPWMRLLCKRFEYAVSLRYMREYLHTFIFFSTPARHLVTCENLLLRNQRKTRYMVEMVAVGLRRARVVEYPKQGSFVPLELEAHRRVLSAVLKKEMSMQDVHPYLHAEPQVGDYLLCCPFSALRSKDYPLGQWLTVLRLIPAETLPPQILLSGSATQTPELQEMAAKLKAEGFQNVEIYTGKSLQDFVNCVAGARMVLTVDTAAAHIAVTLDRPAVILHSGLHQGMFAPWRSSEKQFWFEAARQGKQKWHTFISPESVAVEAERLLRNASH